MNEPTPTRESPTIALTMALCACVTGFAVELTHGLYDPTALLLLTTAILVCIAGVWAARIRSIPALPPWISSTMLGVLIVAQVVVIVLHNQIFIGVSLGAAVVGVLALAQVLAVRRWRWLATAVMAIAFVIVASRAFQLNWKNPNIDVFMFQQMSANALVQGQNPYEVRFPSMYPYGTPYYGRQVVDRNNQLLYGFPYPPLSLLLVLPGCFFGGDCRFMDVLAVALTAVLMVAARPGRWAALVASLFLLTPPVFFVIERSWTEPLVAFTFSLVMFCALRWRTGLPYALGLFFATKQYTVLVVPLIWLLTSGPNGWRQFRVVLTKAVAVVVAICLPFVVWNPVEFVRNVVVFQFLQPFRGDALSYLAWIKAHYPGFRIRSWTPFVGVIPAIPFSIWRCGRTPAGFAAATTVVFLLFFAFNKQAFCNYYYLEIATACWAAVAAGPVPRPSLLAGSALPASP